MDILYEDNHIIVAYKPSGILSQADGSDKEDMLSILKDYIKAKYNKPGNVYLGLVHRLDINTSGVMVFAKTSKAASRLSEQIQKHEFKKTYLALAEGVLNNKEFITLENKLAKDEASRIAYESKDGKLASLEYRSLDCYKVNNIPCSLLEIKLHTGRFHQIRCQMKLIGHPLYGDTKYGSKNTVDKLSFPLQAYKLEFIHPTTKECLCFQKINNTQYIKYSL